MSKINLTQFVTPAFGLRLGVSAAALGMLLTFGAVGSAGAQNFNVKRCVNMGNQLEGLPSEGDWGRRIERADFRAIAGMGFDTVRVPVRWNNKAEDTPPYTIEPTWMDRVAEVVRWAQDFNLQVIINVHHYDELYADPAAESDKFVALWAQIAARFQDQPDTVSFEVLNEPRDGLTNANLPALQNAAIAVIRETNPTRSIIVGGASFNSIADLETYPFPDDPNLVATFHSYEPFEFTHQGADFLPNPPLAGRPWNQQVDEAVLEEIAQRGAAVSDALGGRPVFVGEFGVYNGEEPSVGDRTAYLETARAAWEQAELPWCVWSFTNTFELREGRDWNTPLLAALGLDGPN